jgi:succinate dehydrogenase / fumarate reductase cytochrome b subunit
MMSNSERPLSPHLQIYKPQMTSVLSILHRMTGIALIVGSYLLIAWVIAAATSEEAYNCINDLVSSTVGKVLLFGWTIALFYHLFNGIRHLFWDMGYLFKLQNAFRAGWAVLGLTVLFTAWVWCPVLFG